MKNTFLLTEEIHRRARKHLGRYYSEGSVTGSFRKSFAVAHRSMCEASRLCKSAEINGIYGIIEKRAAKRNNTKDTQIQRRKSNLPCCLMLVMQQKWPRNWKRCWVQEKLNLRSSKNYCVSISKLRNSVVGTENRCSEADDQNSSRVRKSKEARHR